MNHVIKSLIDCDLTNSSLRKLVFNCGDEQDEQELSRYLKQYALKNDLLGVAKTFVAITDDKQVLGYYTLSASLINFSESFIKENKLPSYPIPVVLIGKLAVQQDCQGTGLGKSLMRDAFLRTVELSKNIGVYAIRVDPSNESKQSYYVQKLGFITLNENLSVFLPLETIRKAIYSK